ncbi:hypothetical protein JTE90_024548 [Oedothorax gibbosus]|uniref:Uncharacterized protein n=1 Tax=Oedothorax gibbosus TaxID=931172 RepID=A0AAV6VF09_9ARAC|nr:hypothetical protein JTE90_024548 [Oedothorax gibbosus]
MMGRGIAVGDCLGAAFEFSNFDFGLVSDFYLRKDRSQGGSLHADNHLTFLDARTAHFRTFKGPTPIISDTSVDTLSHHFHQRQEGKNHDQFCGSFLAVQTLPGMIKPQEPDPVL